MNKWLIGLACVGMLAVSAATALGQSVVINEIRNDAPDAIELVVVQDGLNMQGMILKDYSSSGTNDSGGAYTFSADALWASVPAGTIIVLQKTNTAADVTVGGGDYNLAVGLQNATYFTAGSGTFDIATLEIIQIKSSGSGQAGSTGAIHTLATSGAVPQFDTSPTPKLKASAGTTAFTNSVAANNSTAALSDFNGTDATGSIATGTIGTFNNADNQTYIQSLRGPAVFSVALDKTDGFTVEQGSSSTITATAANGTAPYGYAWSSTLGGSFYSTNSNVFTILATAPTGSYSATATATDAAMLTTNKTVTFSVVAPATKYSITITPPVNGTVTTTPATEAAAGATVAITATPAGGYAVDTYSVVGVDTTVIGNSSSFTMPAQGVVVTVTFKVSVAPDALIDFETYTGGYAGNIYSNGGVVWAMTNVFAGNSADDRKNGTKSGRFENNRGGVGHPAQMQSSAFAQPITKISLWYANYAANDGGAFKVQVSDDGSAWQDVGSVYDPSSTNLVEAVIDSIPAGMTYMQIITTAGSAQRVNIDDIGLFFGVATYGVTVDKTDGFTVDQGSSSAITATAANGTAPYTYAWISTLGPSFYSTNANVFTILATAPTGSYSATVTATDSALLTTNKTVTFSVVTPATQYPITIAPPVNGTVTTTPATNAAAGATVTINATPAGGYAVGTYSVVGADTTVIGTTSSFVMPAQGVTVSVTFQAVVAEGIAAFRFSATPYLQVTTKDANIAVADMALSAGTIETAIETGTYFPNEPYIEETGGWTNDNQAGAKAYTFTITPGVGASVTITGISFRAYATSAGPSAFGYDIGGGMASYSMDAPSAVLAVVSQAVTGVVGQTGAIAIKIQGWLNGSRASTGAGIFKLDDVVIFGTVSGGSTPTVSIVGDMSGTVGTQMDLAIALQNGTAADWVIDFKDPDGMDDSSYAFDFPGTGAFSFTPTKVGTYTLWATALDGATSPIASNSVTLAVSAASANPPIASITFVAGTGFTFQVPAGYTLVRVEGADTAVVASALVWTTLSSPTDYSVSGTTVTIKSAAAVRRLVRIVLTPL